jgi:ferritin
MKMSDQLLKAMNDQANMEFASAYLYLGMCYNMEEANLKGTAHWLRKQYEEELTHAYKILDFIEDRDGKVELPAIPAYTLHFDCPFEVSKTVLAHEQKVTASIRHLFGMAREEKDYEAEIFLQWYVNEQIEEEVNSRDLVDKFGIAKDCKGAVMMLDAELAKR